jgi:hypothetical protein
MNANLDIAPIPPVIADVPQRNAFSVWDQICPLTIALKKADATTDPDNDRQAEGDQHALLASIGAQFAQRRLTEL